MNLYDKNQQTIAAVDEAAPSEPEIFHDAFRWKKFQERFCNHVKAYWNATTSVSGVGRVRQPHPIRLHSAEHFVFPRMSEEWEALASTAESFAPVVYLEICSSNVQDFLRNEGLRSQHMAKRRASISQSTEPNLIDRLQDEVDRLATENRALLSVCEAREQEYQILSEKRTGTITEKLGDQIEVAYDLPDGLVKQIYRLGQIKGNKLPSEGDRVEARLSLVVVDKPQRNASDLESPLPSFEDIESPKEVSI